MVELKETEQAEKELDYQVGFSSMKEGSVRFCVDYQKLNGVTERDSYVIHRMDECIDSIGDALIFLTLSANCNYCQLETEEADRDKTPITFQHRLYGFCCTEFGH